MNNLSTHITVCICTYKRRYSLSRLLDALVEQESNGLFTYSIVVVDNDIARSAESVIAELTPAYHIPITYCVEPRQSIALARNKAIENATGDFLAFIDDDEFPIKRWLLNLFTVCEQCGVDGVLGPVQRYFDEEPPQWLVKGNFYQRPIRPTGLVVQWPEARTGNVLLKRQLFANDSHPFRSEFRTGEDIDFFRRMITLGHVFVWSSEAIVYEVVPPIRWKRSFLLRRALLRGAINRIQPTFGLVSITKSLIAVPVYAVALPVALLLGHHRFMMLLVKLCDHLGKVLASIGIDPIRDPYVTE